MGLARGGRQQQAPGPPLSVEICGGGNLCGNSEKGSSTAGSPLNGKSEDLRERE